MLEATSSPQPVPRPGRVFGALERSATLDPDPELNRVFEFALLGAGADRTDDGCVAQDEKIHGVTRRVARDRYLKYCIFIRVLKKQQLKRNVNAFMLK